MTIARLLAWGIALTLVALPIVGVLNGWFASERWPVDRLAVRAEFNHVSAEQIRAAAQPLLGKGFFAIDLDQIRAAVARLPWVERVEARKHWPDVVDLVVYEHQPYAHWGDGRLISRHGKIFTVAGGEGVQGLPRLSGPDERVDDVLRFYADCLNEFSGSGLSVAGVTLTARGGWRLDLASGATIEIGRDDGKRRLQRFLDVWPRIATSKPTLPASIDLRYENGFVVHWAAPPSTDAATGDGHAVPPARPADPQVRGERNEPRAALQRHRLLADARIFLTPDSRLPTP